jgi:hypothetical protein
MRQILNLLVIVLALSTCCGSAIVSASNPLSGHPSPYLAIHADDPVHWQSWQAKAESLIPIARGKVVAIDRQVSTGANNHPAMFLQIKFTTGGSLPAGLPVKISVDAN